MNENNPEHKAVFQRWISRGDAATCWTKVIPTTQCWSGEFGARVMSHFQACVSAACWAASLSSSSLARSGRPLPARHSASWQALAGCVAAGKPLLHMVRAWKAWEETLRPPRSLTSWAALRRSLRESSRGASSSSESCWDSQSRRGSDRKSAGRRAQGHSGFGNLTLILIGCRTGWMNGTVCSINRINMSNICLVN